MYPVFCTRLLDLRAESEFTQQQVADGIKVSKARYQHYETGRREPDIALLIALADFFGTTLDDLVGRVQKDT